MPGMAHQGLAAVKTALAMLQKAVSEIPMGSPMHQKVLRAITDITKDLGEGDRPGGGEPSPDMAQQVAQMARQGPNPAAQSAMQKLFPGGGGQPAPPMPPMGA